MQTKMIAAMLPTALALLSIVNAAPTSYPSGSIDIDANRNLHKRNPDSACSSKPKAFYVCANNGFRGDCSADPCNQDWCVDYKPGTYDPICISGPVDPSPVCEAKPKFRYVCASNGFNGYCSADPCDKDWCIDYKLHTYEPMCNSGSVVPSANPSPIEPNVNTDPADPNQVCKNMPKNHYVCANNGFVGDCSEDPCNKDWCVDYKPSTYDSICKDLEPVMN